jgi:hypothetical protein
VLSETGFPSNAVLQSRYGRSASAGDVGWICALLFMRSHVPGFKRTGVRNVRMNDCDAAR